jgi:hypothetical protein
LWQGRHGGTERFTTDGCETKRETGRAKIIYTQGPVPSDLFPSARFYFPQFPEPPKIAPPFQYMSLFREHLISKSTLDKFMVL